MSTATLHFVAAVLVAALLAYLFYAMMLPEDLE